MTNETQLFSIKSLNEQEIKDVLNEIYNALEERGYNPTNQIVGYLISGDPGYISSYKDARNKIQKFDRTSIVEALFKTFRENK